jgi:hypothetical protein
MPNEFPPEINFGKSRSLSFRVFFFKDIGDVFEDDQAERNALVLGSIHWAAALVYGVPESLFEYQIIVGSSAFLDAGFDHRKKEVLF